MYLSAMRYELCCMPIGNTESDVGENMQIIQSQAGTLMRKCPTANSGYTAIVDDVDIVMLVAAPPST